MPTPVKALFLLYVFAIALAGFASGVGLALAFAAVGAVGYVAGFITLALAAWQSDDIVDRLAQGRERYKSEHGE